MLANKTADVIEWNQKARRDEAEGLAESAGLAQALEKRAKMEVRPWSRCALGGRRFSFGAVCLWSHLSVEPVCHRARVQGAERRGGERGGEGLGSGADGARGQAEEASKGQGAEGGGAAEADGPASGPPTEAGEVPPAPLPAPPLPPPAVAAAPRVTGAWSHFAASEGCFEPFYRA